MFVSVKVTVAVEAFTSPLTDIFPFVVVIVILLFVVFKPVNEILSSSVIDTSPLAEIFKSLTAVVNVTSVTPEILRSVELIFPPVIFPSVIVITALFALIYYYKIEYKSQFRKKLMKSIYLFILGIILPLIPYFCWVFISYGTIFTSHFMYYPFAVDPEDVDTILHGDPDMVVKKFFSTPISKILWVKVIDIVVTLTPATLPINPIATSFRTYFPVYYYSHDYPGALSTLMYILIVIWFIRYILRKSKTDKILFIFVAVPFILFLVVSGWLDWGMLTAGLHPTIPILIMLGFNELEKVTQDKLKYLLKIFVFVGAIIENTIFMWLLLAFYKLEGGITQVEEGIRRYIPNFNVSKFVSAHFFTGNFEAMSIVLNTFIFLALIIILLIFLFRINKTLFTEYSPKNWEF